MSRQHPQRGAALLTAMIIVTLIASLAAGMVWQQYRAVQIEAADRARAQSTWILQGALDWARLILQEDAKGNRNKTIDHLGEPWAVPLAEARLSTFLAADNTAASSDDGPEAFLSGSIEDAQSRYNLANLMDQQGKISKADVEILQRLCDIVGVVPTVADQLAEAMKLAAGQGSTGDTGAAASIDSTIDPPVKPVSEDDLAWLGVDPASLEKLRPFITLLPISTPVNLNTAPKEVIAAVVKGSDLSTAERIVRTRERNPLKKVDDAAAIFGAGVKPEDLKDTIVSVTSSFFEVYGALRLENRLFEERSLVQRRDTLQVVPIRRERVHGPRA